MMQNGTDTTTEVLSSEDKEMVSMDSEGRSVNSSRRRLAKFVVGTPILVTLASRPVLAAGCLSNMMSGNLSDPNRGHCSKGWSPGGWGQPGGSVSIYSTIGAWTAVNLAYGTLDPSLAQNCSTNGAINQSACYTGGATLANVPSSLNKDGIPTTTPLRVVLNDTQLGQLTRHLVCAYLNSLLSGLSGSTFKYILTTKQVEGLASGATAYPTALGSLQDFLGSTW